MLRIFVVIAATATVGLNSTLATAQSCLALCNSTYDTCQKYCKTDDCVKGCFRGYEGCKNRCGSSEAPLRSRIAVAGDLVAKSPIRLACAQTPNACSSSRDCTCSGCCAQLGEGGPHVCQPSCK